MKKKILITGGLGYLGGRISQFLSEQDYKVIIGEPFRVPEKPDWLNDGEIKKLDVLSDDTIANSMSGVEAVVHLAAVNEVVCGIDPEKAFLVNSLGTLKTLRTAIDKGVKRFIFFSTAHVYGSPLHGKLTEEALCRPGHPYSITHKSAEDFVLAYRDKSEIEGIVIRLSNGFGAPERFNVDRWMLVANDLCKQAVEKKVLRLKSSGQKRDFITLKDVARAVEHLLELPFEQTDNGIFNVGGGNTMSIKDLAEKISERTDKLFGYKPEIIIESKENIKVQKEEELDYSITKICSTGFELTGDIDSEIDATLRLCQKAFALDSNE